MGWTETYYYTKLSHKERRQELDKLFTWESESKTYKVLRSSIVSNTYYAAVEMIEKESGSRDVWGTVCLMSERKEGYGYWYGYKYMSEDMGPYYYDCPIKILDLLTPTDNEQANEWRKRCYEKAKKPKLSSMKEGDRIKFICPWQTTYHNPGDEITLTKTLTCRRWNTAGYGSRNTYRWMEDNGRIYWKQSMIPDNYEVESDGEDAVA